MSLVKCFKHDTLCGSVWQTIDTATNDRDIFLFGNGVQPFTPNVIDLQKTSLSGIVNLHLWTEST